MSVTVDRPDGLAITARAVTISTPLPANRLGRSRHCAAARRAGGASGLSYAEALPLQGVTAASFGAAGDTLHSDNTRWAVGMCDALAAGAATIGELVTRAAPASLSAIGSYRLIGDPLAPLASATGAVARASAIPTYP